MRSSQLNTLFKETLFVILWASFNYIYLTSFTIRYEGLASQEKTDQGLQTNEDLYYTQLYRMCNQLLNEIQRDEL